MLKYLKNYDKEKMIHYLSLLTALMIVSYSNSQSPLTIRNMICMIFVGLLTFSALCLRFQQKWKKFGKNKST